MNLRLHPRDKISWLETGLKAARMMKDQGNEGVHLGNLGLAYIYLGETRKAIGYLERALNISRKVGNRSGECAYLGNLGLAYADLGETRKAIEYYEQALIIAREIGDRRGEGVHLGNLGVAYADWARRARPSSTTSRPWPSHARSVTRRAKDRPGQPGPSLR